jgi:Rrf2 family protein
MRLSLQVQYAICAVFDLAYNGGGEPVQVRVVGERQGVPARYLEQIFQRLRRERLVEGKRGPGGGYRLARPPAEIRLRDIVEALEGPLERALGAGPPPRGRGASHRPSFLWRDLAARIGHALEETTIESLCRTAARSAVRRAGSDSHTYVI